MGSRHKKHWNKALLTALVVLLVLALSFLAAVLNVNNNVIYYWEKEATLNVSNYVGINLDTDKIHFGTISYSGFAERAIFLDPGVEGYFYITADDSLSELIYIGYKQDLHVMPDENKTVVLYATTNEDPALRINQTYNGLLRGYLMKQPANAIDKFFLKGTELRKIDPESLTQTRVSIEIVRNDTLEPKK